jgi:two-component system OmpR family response regulator
MSRPRVSPTAPVPSHGGVAVAIVEDDSQLRRTLSGGLIDEGFSVVLAVATGAELLERWDAAAPELLVLDIGLPDADGRDVAMALRARGVGVPILMLTARGNLVDRLGGFHAGADDYLVKPFAFAELIVRLAALARRRADGETSVEGIRLNPATHAVSTTLDSGGSIDVPLTPTEFRLLALLIARRGQVVRRRALVAGAWPEGAIVTENTLDTYVARIRRKIALVAPASSVRTVRGVGYRFD